jgi:hypothetical protein
MITVADLKYSVKDIIALTMHPLFSGFTAATCSCGASANVITTVPGWFCPCGKYNGLPWYEETVPHANPTFGPSARVIRNGIRIGRLVTTVKNWWKTQ